MLFVAIPTVEQITHANFDQNEDRQKFWRFESKWTQSWRTSWIRSVFRRTRSCRIKQMYAIILDSRSNWFQLARTLSAVDDVLKEQGINPSPTAYLVTLVSFCSTKAYIQAVIAAFFYIIRHPWIKLPARWPCSIPPRCCPSICHLPDSSKLLLPYSTYSHYSSRCVIPCVRQHFGGHGRNNTIRPWRCGKSCSSTRFFIMEVQQRKERTSGIHDLSSG